MIWVMCGAAALFGLLLTLGACTSSGDGGAAPTGSVAVQQDAITVVVALPHESGILFGPATGRVLARDGSEVAEFTFDSGWDAPPDWNWDDPTPSRSQALTELEVRLPSSGTYTFVLEEFTTSGSPCGTCESGYEGGSVKAEVLDGSVVPLPSGEQAWVS